jgi:ATP-dependent RNA helicase RhlE
LRSPARIEVARAGTANVNVSQELIVVDKTFKPKLLIALAKEHAKETILVFSRTKHGATRLCRDLQRAGETAAEIHADRTLGQRKAALEGFKKGTYRILVATDIAARGIDVTGIGIVVNYDIPENSEDYVHRIGRTGRAGLAGMAISFATPEQSGLVRGIERLTRTIIPRKAHQSVPAVDFTPGAYAATGRGGRSSGGSSGRPVRFERGVAVGPRPPAPAASAPRPAYGAPRPAYGAARGASGPRRDFAPRTKSVNPRRAFEIMDSPERFDPRQLKRRPGKPAPKPKTDTDVPSFGEGEFSFKTSLVL